MKKITIDVLETQWFSVGLLFWRLDNFVFKYFELEFYGPINTGKVMLSQSVNLLKLILGGLNPLKD